MLNETLHNIRHSFAHVLASAVLKAFPEARLGVGPVIENGCYYDFLLPRTLVPEDLKNIQKEMKKIIGRGYGFERTEVSAAEARVLFKDQPFKQELIDDLEKFGTTELTNDLRQTTNDVVSRQSSVVSIYRTGDFTDLCRGGHVENTKELDVDAFQVEKFSGAYWRGDQSREQLQRIYVLAFEKKEELDAFITMRTEAEKRDHKKLGAALDLFVFSDLVGPGLPLFTPKGTVIREVLETFVQSLQEPRGYQRVCIPHITKRALYETSGHWQKFSEELFRVTSREKHEFALKPMNCPHHTQIFSSRKRSYRELPLRYSEVTMCYRDEQTGELAGLSRLRGFTQDDAHVFCRMSQVSDEVFAVWDIVDEFYKAFAMPLTVRLSTHDPAHMEKYLGTPETWAEAEKQLTALVERRGVPFIDGKGEAAMYGPKIDFIAKDALGRDWQLATIQLDFNLPERFNLFCVNEKGVDERVVMIHRAILGAVERFTAVLIEHYAGAFPIWLAPVQAAVLSIGEKHVVYAHEVAKKLKTAGIRAELRDDDATIGKKIRECEMQKIPYLLVVGDKEVEAGTVAVRERGEGDTGAVKMDEFAARLQDEIEKKK